VFKKIELYGFKSFADRLEVDFSSGVTCIVGPNGCGKSNVSDAIRWVLGEQSSRALRGTNMQDVIFKGTENRKQLGYCEVHLYFDNSSKIFPVDYEEVVLGRKLYRSGESEYLLNKTQVRLKDITTILHDSGIDRDGLTIIGQGQVTEIMNAKPESRRGIFEEAAGIAKFKSRKTEAERKLERVAAELVRVNDVISEINRTLGPLLKQAEAAREFVAIKERLKVLEINAYIHSYDNQAEQKQTLQERLDRASSDLENKKALIEQLATLSQSTMDELAGIDQRAEVVRQTILELSVSTQKSLGDGEKISFLEQQRAGVLAEIESLRERHDFEAKNLEGARAVVGSLRSEGESLSAQIKEISGAHANAESLAQKLEVMKARRSQLIGRRETVLHMAQSGEGFKFAVKKLLEEKQRGNQTVAQNIIGVVQKLLTVPTELELAVEVALGAGAQNIIVRDENNARNMIELLSKNNWGRATFMPISAVRHRGLTNEELAYTRYSGVEGVAADLIKYHESIAPVIKSMLGRVIVVDNIGTAVDIARQSRYAFKIVTLDGDVIEPRGSITGGSKSALGGVMWHTNTLAQIDRELKQIDEQLARVGKSTDERGLGAQLTQLRVRHAGIESELGHVAASIERGTVLTRELGYTLKQKEAQLESIRNTLDNARDGGGVDMYEHNMVMLERAKVTLAGFDTQKDEMRARVADAEKQRNEAMDDAAKLHELYYKTAAALEKVDADLNAMQERIWEEYGLNYASCYELKLPDFDYAFSLREITELRRDITKLGPVNLLAIDQSVTEKERFDDYTTQVADLDSAKADLEKVINDLEGEMVGRFRDTFNQINENFGIVFRELFGGGRARLELSDPHNILESGIEIIAEPTGKKLQNISLLSGGEKALTAIAILFAILKLKPMPFCLLDEIEAALDEANVGRFASYLQRYSDRPDTDGAPRALDANGNGTQFIVITHRKPTMELADHLYGVTMEERGVSKLVSVKLEAYA